MLTLQELFNLTWDIAEVHITARRPEDCQFIHKWIFGEDIQETVHMYHDRKEGKLTIRNVKIQYHGDTVRGGSEMGWGVKEKTFPRELIEAPVTHLSMISLPQGRGTKVRVDIEIPEITVMMLVKTEERECVT